MTNPFHRAAAEQHARSRAKERYGIDLDEETLLDHLALVLAGESTLIGRQSHRKREVHHIEHGDAAFLVVFDPGLMQIVTYLPMVNLGREYVPRLKRTGGRPFDDTKRGANLHRKRYQDAAE